MYRPERIPIATKEDIIERRRRRRKSLEKKRAKMKIVRFLPTWRSTMRQKRERAQRKNLFHYRSMTTAWSADVVARRHRALRPAGKEWTFDGLFKTLQMAFLQGISTRYFSRPFLQGISTRQLPPRRHCFVRDSMHTSPPNC
jgi:hypothetical protein